MRFVAIFFAVFIPLTMVATSVGGTGEMFAFAIFANIFYAVIGGLGWVVTDRFIGIDTQLRSVCSILLGLVILNLTVYFGGGGALLTPALLGTDGTAGAFRISLAIHIIFLLSFSVAHIDKRRHSVREEE